MKKSLTNRAVILERRRSKSSTRIVRLASENAVFLRRVLRKFLPKRLPPVDDSLLLPRLTPCAQRRPRYLSSVDGYALPSSGVLKIPVNRPSYKKHDVIDVSSRRKASTFRKVPCHLRISGNLSCNPRSYGVRGMSKGSRVTSNTMVIIPDRSKKLDIARHSKHLNTAVQNINCTAFKKKSKPEEVITRSLSGSFRNVVEESTASDPRIQAVKASAKPVTGEQYDDASGRTHPNLSHCGASSTGTNSFDSGHSRKRFHAERSDGVVDSSEPFSLSKAVPIQSRHRSPRITIGGKFDDMHVSKKECEESDDELDMMPILSEIPQQPAAMHGGGRRRVMAPYMGNRISIASLVNAEGEVWKENTEPAGEAASESANLIGHYVHSESRPNPLSASADNEFLSGGNNGRVDSAKVKACDHAREDSIAWERRPAVSEQLPRIEDEQNTSEAQVLFFRDAKSSRRLDLTREVLRIFRDDVDSAGCITKHLHERTVMLQDFDDKVRSLRTWELQLASEAMKTGGCMEKMSVVARVCHDVVSVFLDRLTEIRDRQDQERNVRRIMQEVLV